MFKVQIYVNDLDVCSMTGLRVCVCFFFMQTPLVHNLERKRLFVINLLTFYSDKFERAPLVSSGGADANGGASRFRVGPRAPSSL